MDLRKCPRCGMEETSWTANLGDGYPKSEKLYCCQGCADGGRCVCRNTEAEESFHVRQESP